MLEKIKSDYSRGNTTWAAQITLMTIITGIVLFVTASRLDWAGGW